MSDANPFVEKLSKPKNTKPLTKASSEVFFKAVILENMGKRIDLKRVDEKDMTSTMKLILKRIEHFKLPINFTVEGMIAVEAIAGGVPGKIVVVMIDCLDRYKDKLVTAKMVGDLYPWGFYNDHIFAEYLDSYIKENKVEWAHIY